MSPPLVRIAGLVLAATLALAPWRTAPAAPGAREALVAAADALAASVARDGWAAAVSAVLAEDAVYLHPGEPLVRGRAEVQAVLARATAGAPGGPGATRLRRLVAGTSADGSLGYAWGFLEAGGAPPGKPAGTPPANTAGTPPEKTAGRWLAAWRRAPAGTTPGGWKLAALVRANAPDAKGEVPADAPLARGYAGVARPGDPAALARAAAEADRAFAARAEEVRAASGYGPAFGEWADAAAMMPGSGGLMWGAPAIRAGYRTEPGEALAWAPDHAEAAASGDLAWTSGRATWRGGGEQVFTKYLTIWARQEDGTWRWLLDLGNRRPGP
ncbi:MAG: nuclear transport factor 2 family protein [Anaeromyxobacter sp.]